MVRSLLLHQSVKSALTFLQDFSSTEFILEAEKKVNFQYDIRGYHHVVSFVVWMGDKIR